MLRTLKRFIQWAAMKAGFAIVRLPKPATPVELSTSAEQPSSDIESAEPPPGLRDLDPALRPYRISMHHVGGRGGGFPFPINIKFWDDIETYIYDADPDCDEQMNAIGNNVDHVISAAVAGRDGTATFYVNYDPYTSSLLAKNEDTKNVFFKDASCDYIIDDVITPVKTLTLEAKSLDTLAKEYKFSVDYLSLDVQGAEYELMEGMSEEAMSSTIGVMCEISHSPFYAGHVTFDRITTLLRERGFFLAQIYPHGFDWHRFRTPIGWRAKGFAMHGDALFLRDPVWLSKNSKTPFVSLYKEAFVSLCYGYVAHALECLTEAQKHRVVVPHEVGYIRFLDTMFELYQKTTPIFPPRFRHIWSIEDSFARFDKEKGPSPAQEKIVTSYFADHDRTTYAAEIAHLRSKTPTPFERLLKANGFGQLADSVAKTRIEISDNMQFMLGV